MPAERTIGHKIIVLSTAENLEYEPFDWFFRLTKFWVFVYRYCLRVKAIQGVSGALQQTRLMLG
jgi:hypothetical protein